MPIPTPLLRTRNAALTFKIESTEGVEAAPSASTDGVLVEVTGSPISYAPQITQTNEVTGSLDPRAPIVGGVQVTLRFAVFLKGSGVAGTAPEFGDLLRCCGWAETITATAVPAAPAALGGGTTSTATLGTAASTTAQAYRGMPVLITGTGGDNGTFFITDYTTGKVASMSETSTGAWAATNNYQVPVNVLYGPASGTIPTGTAYLYMDGVLHKVLGCRGTFSLRIDAGGAGRLVFTLAGMYGGKSDVAVPSVTYDATRPPIWRGGRMTINRRDMAVSQLSLDGGNDLIFPPDPNSAEGFAPAIITARRIRGAMDPNATLVASGDLLADLRASTQRAICADWGTASGNRVGVTIPAAQFEQVNPGDRQGVTSEEVQFFADGQNAGAFLCFF